MYIQVSVRDMQFFYMEESGDLRSSSVCEEMGQALRRAVSHFQDISRSPVQKVQFTKGQAVLGMKNLIKLTW
jgi:hypothetical protein